MKRIIPLLLAALLCISAKEDIYSSYISKYSPIAVEEMSRTGIPASITIAQAILESRVGQSPLATKGNNHFGIKCHNDWSGKTMHADDDSSAECFRVYPSAEASFRDHSNFLRGRDRYKALFELSPTDYKAWAHGLKAAGYATDPRYAQKLIDLIERYELGRYDSPTTLPASPKQLETPKPLSSSNISHKYKESFLLSFEREVFVQNGTPFIHSREGESYSSIAREHNLFLSELLKFNDLSSETALEEGTIVYLSRKAKQGPAGVESFVVDSPDETFYRISQRFGIRLVELKKLNILLLAKPLQEGDTVILRKPRV